jgi:RNA 3'-terminal phosphate cyclase (ATP)
MIEIDGSHGEGGGQVLRTALSLSCLSGKPFRMHNIRKGRKRPGLMQQHLMSIRAAQVLSGARVEGDNIGSQDIAFSPGIVRGGDFYFDIKTAGSAMLVLQTLLPALITAGKKAAVRLRGGTHVPFSPSYHYIEGVFLPCLKEIGADVRMSITSYGFYPRGGGEIRAELLASGELQPIRKIERGQVTKITGYSAAGNLSPSIAERQRKAALEKIRSDIHELPFPGEIDILNVMTPGQGTFIHIQSEAEHSNAGFTALGKRGKRAEAVGEEAASGFIRYYATGAALDPYLPDQVALYLSLCGKKSMFTTSRLTGHLVTNLWVIGRFHEFSHSVEGLIGEPGMVKIGGRGFP